jgi:hypothetical protein
MSILTVFENVNRVTILEDAVIVNAPAVVGPRGPRGESGEAAANAALANAFVIAGDGLVGGGNLASNVNIAVNSTVVRTSGDQNISGNKIFGSVLYVDVANSRVGINSADAKIDLQIGDVGLGTYSVTTSTTLPNQLMDTWSATDFRSAKYQVQVYSATAGEYEISEIFVLHDDSEVFFTEYAVINQGTRLMEFSASIFNSTVRLLGTPTYAINEVKVFRTVLSA